MVLFELGVSQGAAYYVAREEWRGPAMVRGVLGACVGLGSAAALTGVVAFAAFGDEVPGMTWPMAVSLSLSMPFALMWRIGPQVALAEERFELFALFDSSAMLIASPTSIIGGAIWGVEGAVIGLAVAFALSGTAIALWLVRSAGRGRDSAAPRGGLRSVISLGSRAWGSELLQQVNQRADLIVLGGFAGAAQSGVYSVALSTTGIAWLMTEAFAVSALPRSARLQAQSERAELTAEESDESDSRVLRHAVLVIPAVAVFEALLLVVGIPIFYGSHFHRSIGLGFILLGGSLGLGVGKVALSVLLARGYGNRVLAIGLAIVPATLVAYLLVIPSGGATGAAIVSTVSYLMFSALAVEVLAASTRIPVSRMVVPQTTDVNDYREALSRIRR
jgi:O-antigen/teichoic acid export membrane protein